MSAQSWTHGLISPERLDPVVTDEFEKLIASLESHLSGFQKDDDGAIVLGGSSTRVVILQGPTELTVKEISLTSDVNGLDPGDATIIRLTSSVASNIHGIIASSTAGKSRLLIVYNVGAQNITIKHNSASATQIGYRLTLAGAADVTLAGGNIRAVWFAYDRETNRWVQLNVTSVAGPTATDATEIDVVNTTVETSVYSTTVLANTLTNRVLLLTLVADILNNSTLIQTLHVRVKWAGTTMLSGSFSVNTLTAPRRAYGLLLAVVGTSASAQRVWGREYYESGNDATGTWAVASDRAAVNVATADLTADQILEVTAQWGAAHAQLSFRKTGAVVQIP